MRRRLRGIFAGVSFAIFVIIGVAIMRSFVVQDLITWSKASGPAALSEEVRESVRRNGGDDAGFVGRQQRRTFAVLRGVVRIHWQDSQYNMGVWTRLDRSEAINKSSRQWWRGPSSDIMFRYPGTGILGALGFYLRTDSGPPIIGERARRGRSCFHFGRSRF